MITIQDPGFYTLKAEDYHADPCPEPSLSGSIAIPLIHRSPRHAWWQHPRLNPAAEPFEASAKMDLGSACHKLLLGAGAEIEEIEAENFTTKAAREARDVARAAGRIPMLSKDMQTAHEMVAVAKDRLWNSVEAKGPGDESGKAEQTMIWREGAIWCRGMVDWLSVSRRVVVDYKTTGTSARPDDIERHFYDMNYHLKAAFYERGLDVLDRSYIGRRRFLFLFQETDPPYECSLIEPSESGMTIGRKQATYAIRRWQQCMATGQWPGYGSEVYRAAAPQWIERRWLEREMNDDFATGETAPDGRIEPYIEQPQKGWAP